MEFGTWPGYEQLDLLMDSGASANAIPSHVAAGVAELPLQPGERLEYYTASGQGAPLSVEFKTMPVRRPIVSVSRMVAPGNTVVSRPEGQ